MSYKILETDESINDVYFIAINAYRYTCDEQSGENVISLYNETVEWLREFPFGYRGISIEHRGYEIHILAFGNYNLFFYIDTSKNEIVVLRVMYQKQNWERILKVQNLYHIDDVKI
jgi:toxin ParE1/3/4